MKKKLTLKFILLLGIPGAVYCQKPPNGGVIVEPLQAKQLEITQTADLGQYVEGLEETPEASYNISTATWGIAGAFPPVIWDYHYYDAFYPWYSNDKVTYYDFEGDTGYRKSTGQTDTIGEAAHKSIAEKGVAKREEVRKKEEEKKRKRHGK